MSVAPLPTGWAKVKQSARVQAYVKLTVHFKKEIYLNVSFDRENDSVHFW